MIDARISYSDAKFGLKNGKFTVMDLVHSYLERIEKYEPKIQAFLKLEKDYILKQAEESDKRRKSGKFLSDCDGIPLGIKDNICIKGIHTTCASRMLENFVSPYNATVIEKCLAKGFILFPRLNMDEFAMGSSTENSAFQVTKNPFDTTRTPGGSSGGSAAAIAAGFLPVSLGSDTGGSIRQPASLCGIYGLKPTYGRISRYGLVAYASSLDQIGPLSNDLEGIRDLLEIVSGRDEKDSTSSSHPPYSDRMKALSPKGLKIGIMKLKGNEEGWEPDIHARFQAAVDRLKSEGAEIHELDFSLLSHSIPIYYLIATAECSSNLSRFDGIRYGYRDKDAKKLEDLYILSRTKGFGTEVKRRILLGTFALSAGYYDAYYGKAQKARILIQKKYKEFFSQVDLILQPTSPTTAFQIGEKTKDPIQMYKADILTTSVNLAGLPGISVPAGLDQRGLPIGLQITAPAFREDLLFGLASTLATYEFLKVPLPEEIR